MKRNNTSVWVGLTGGIAAGKSLASERLREIGADILDADILSRSALEKDGPCFNRVVSIFGSSILTETGDIDRKKLGDIVFSDEAGRQKLNAVVHPYVIHSLLKAGCLSKKRVIVFDVPLLIECGLYRMMDCVVIVTAPDPVRIERIMKRNGLSEYEARARLDSQIAQSEQIRYADYVLQNSGSVSSFLLQVDELYCLLNEKKIPGRKQHE